MTYILESTEFFLKQLKDLNRNTRRILQKKLSLAKKNPYRFKRIKGFSLFLFRIRITENKRVVYMVDRPFIKIICITDRKHGYNDLKKYLDKITPS